MNAYHAQVTLRLGPTGETKDYRRIVFVESYPTVVSASSLHTALTRIGTQIESKMYHEYIKPRELSGVEIHLTRGDKLNKKVGK